MTVMTPELTLRSVSNDWNLARWETLAHDGNRYEVLDGVLYMTTLPLRAPVARFFADAPDTTL